MIRRDQSYCQAGDDRSDSYFHRPAHRPRVGIPEPYAPIRIPATVMPGTRTGPDNILRENDAQNVQHRRICQIIMAMGTKQHYTSE